jgi:fluoride ion exporter CrcB/FEX
MPPTPPTPPMTPSTATTPLPQPPRLPRMVELLVLALVAGAGGTFGAGCRAGAMFAARMLGQPAWVAYAAVNVIGALLAGLVVGWFVLPEATNPLRAADRPLRRREHLIVTGILGGLTTVSGFAWDASALVLRAIEPAPAARAAELASETGAAGSDRIASASDALPQLALAMVANGAVGLAAAWLGLAMALRFRRGGAVAARAEA